MSYPHLLNVLVIEDNDAAKDWYEEALSEERNTHRTHLRFAFNLEEAITALDEDVPYHVVLTDLRIPERRGLPEPDHSDFGREVISRCEKRDKWPIPALLVVSGHLDPRLERELEERLARGFGYSAIRNRGDVSADLEKACDYVRQYCSIGVVHHTKPDTAAQALCARDEDLLRRLCLEKGCIGVHLIDWGSSVEARGGRMSSVFVGRFFTRDYDECGYKFLKFLHENDAQYVAPSAQDLALRLPHANVFGTLRSTTRTLIASDKAGDDRKFPNSIQDFVSLDPNFVRHYVDSLARQVSSQLNRLGTSTPNRVLPRDLLRSGLANVDGKPAAEVCQEEMARFFGGACSAEVDQPIKTLELIASQQDYVSVNERTCHGDLNAGNIALDIGEDAVSAYLFDPGFMKRDFAVRDLALLEVTILLFQVTEEGSLVEACRGLYDGTMQVPLGTESSNVYQLVASLRREAERICDQKVYAAILFDVAFGQVWGLRFSKSHGNKIKSPSEAVRLLLHISEWARKEWELTIQGDAGAYEPGF